MFCGQMQAQLKRHVIRKHQSHEQVRAAMQLPKAEQARAFDAIKKRGIYLENVKRIDKSEKTLICERNQGDWKGKVLCSGCKGFYSKRRIKRHKKQFCSRSANISPKTIHFKKIPTTFFHKLYFMITQRIHEWIKWSISDKMNTKTSKVLIALCHHVDI